MRERAVQAGRELQEAIHTAVEELDGGRFFEENWERSGGGGGRSLTLSHGKGEEGVFEKAGLNFSEVHGELSEEFASRLAGDGRSFFATGVSLVFHPRSPRVPAVHANFRYIEKGDRWWFGGGADLTPYRLYPEDARHFHSVWKEVCDRHDPAFHARFKKWCDEYFFLPHRGEARGIGGIFFDDLTGDAEALFGFWEDVGRALTRAYLPLVERRRGEAYTEGEREFQLKRRGRYVEFNLLYDRGTQFGLKTGGRVESILMSLPPEVTWPSSVEVLDPAELELLEVLKKPRDWLLE